MILRLKALSTARRAPFEIKNSLKRIDLENE
jgi:hypothetical protein